MFDIAFSELVIVSIVALLVIGPERLPETIRTMMLWLGRIRRTFTNIKSEIEQEIGADEIRRQLHNETILKDIQESKNQIQGALRDADQSVQDFKQSIQDSVDGKSGDQGIGDPDAENPSSSIPDQVLEQEQALEKEQKDSPESAGEKKA
ncbi:MAG: Sec-independent protein translocase protein TatB [Pseudomonadales bacterium]